MLTIMRGTGVASGKRHASKSYEVRPVYLTRLLRLPFLPVVLLVAHHFMLPFREWQFLKNSFEKDKVHGDLYIRDKRHI